MRGRKPGRRRAVRIRRRAWLVGLAAAALFVVLYYRPVRTYMKAQDTLRQRSHEVRDLAKENAALTRRLRLDESGATLVREARKLGLVRSDERLFIIQGIDAWQRQRGAGGKG